MDKILLDYEFDNLCRRLYAAPIESSEAYEALQDVVYWFDRNGNSYWNGEVYETDFTAKDGRKITITIRPVYGDFDDDEDVEYEIDHYDYRFS